MTKHNEINGTCPVCNGSGRMTVPKEYRNIGMEKGGWYGYRASDDMMNCNNCGSQYMYGKPTGQVKLNKSGMPCRHEYQYRLAGRCYHEYTCKHCSDRYYIDSGD